MSKYKSIETVADGIKFASKREAFYYQIFKKLEHAGKIKDLILQERFNFTLDGKYMFYYKADFSYIDCVDNKKHIYDVKGVRTAVFNLKKKLIEHQHKIEIEILK